MVQRVGDLAGDEVGLVTVGQRDDDIGVVRAGAVWFALETDAELVVARANPKQFEILKRYTVADSATWAQPVLTGNRLLVKDVSTISLWIVE